MRNETFILRYAHETFSDVAALVSLNRDAMRTARFHFVPALYDALAEIDLSPVGIQNLPTRTSTFVVDGEAWERARDDEGLLVHVERLHVVCEAKFILITERLAINDGVSFRYIYITLCNSIRTTVRSQPVAARDFATRTCTPERRTHRSYRGQRKLTLLRLIPAHQAPARCQH